MNAEEENRLLEPVEEEDEDESTTQKPDDVPELCTRKRKEVTRSEFESLQVQVSSVTTAINNFGDILKSFMGSEKKPRYDNELLAAQSAPYSAQSVSSAAHAATFVGDQPSFATAQSGAGLDNLLPSFALQSHPNEQAPDFVPFASPGHESLEVEYGRWRLYTVVGPLLFVSLNSGWIMGSEAISYQKVINCASTVISMLRGGSKNSNRSSPRLLQFLFLINRDRKSNMFGGKIFAILFARVVRPTNNQFKNSNGVAWFRKEVSTFPSTTGEASAAGMSH